MESPIDQERYKHHRRVTNTCGVGRQGMFYKAFTELVDPVRQAVIVRSI